ncbi:hypothetical protein BJX64DRAFT_259249 [Aspergillus heterothallicus]
MSSSGLSDPENDDELADAPSITPRANRGTHRKALRTLQSSLLPESADAYKIFFEQQSDPNVEENKFTTTQDGIVIWTAEEKRLFYQALDTKGKDGVREIAAAIGTKSELEVQEYLRLLQKGLRRQHFSDANLRTAILGDIPAATEISAECSVSLEQHAELLRLTEQAEENIEGRLRHGQQWIVDQEISEQLEADFGTGNEEPTVAYASSAAPASASEPQTGGELSSPLIAPAKLFKMTKWILLSERLFMNFGGAKLEDNWVNVAFEDETPSITADAFAIFYDIALTVTRRLVHATHFFAASRVQRLGSSSRPSARVVASSDVRRAARTLNMKTDSSDVWVGLARRCNFDVVDERHTRGWNPISLDHDEVEELLSRRDLPKEPYKTNLSRSVYRRRSSSEASEMSVDSLEFESSEDEHAEAVDRQNSAIDELLCWTVIGESPTGDVEAQLSNNHIPPRPAGKRKTMEELVDWRERTLHRSEWEELGYEIEYLDRDSNCQRKRPRLTTLSPSPSRSRSRSRSRSHFKSNPRVSDSDSPSSRPPYKSQEKITNPDSGSDPDSDPAFHPESPQQKSKSRTTRTSSRARTPVSYAPQQLFDFDVEMDLGAGSGQDDSEAPGNPHEQSGDEDEGITHVESHPESAQFGDEIDTEDEEGNDPGVGVESNDDGGNREDLYESRGSDYDSSNLAGGGLSSDSEVEFEDWST